MIESRVVLALIERLRQIPEGTIASTARRAKMEPTALSRLRRGENADIRLSTLGRISEALGEPIGQMLGESPAKPGQLAYDPVPQRLVKRAQKQLLAAADAIERLAARFPDEDNG